MNERRRIGIEKYSFANRAIQFWNRRFCFLDRAFSVIGKNKTNKMH
jgi:hypothetical protein